MDKERVIYLHNGVLLNRQKKKKDIIKFADKWMELDNKSIQDKTTQNQKIHLICIHRVDISF